MKLKQRVVLLAILLVIFIFTKVFLIDNLDTSAANREDQRAFHRMMAGLRVELVPKLDHTLQSPWEIAAQWVVPREVYPEETPELGAILHAMATKKIIKADVGYKGTQLKALLILEGGQKVVFKPKRYNRDYVVEGEPYAGYDRHNAEVAAFHLDRFVNLRTEIKPVATEQLLSTFLTVDVWPLQKHRHPWGRTYREGKLASIRVSTWNRLNSLKNGVLKSALKSAMAHDPISPVLADPHLDAAAQRLLSVLATVKQCTDQFGMDSVLRSQAQG
ncbi:hypothetical protein Celaphus_00011156, partial [Cervus elaphus hippelaphus]